VIEFMLRLLFGMGLLFLCASFFIDRGKPE
jgi:hypothetical protein